METQQILDRDIKDEDLKSQFDDLMDAIYSGINWNGVEGVEGDVMASCETLNERVLLEVNAKPILARIISCDFLNWSLLTTACTKLEREWSHPAIKCLIETNPAALLWKRSDHDDCPIYELSGNEHHCKLLPWIALNYPWVLDECIERPPVFDMIRKYGDRDMNGFLGDTLKHFFEMYPTGLTQEDIVVGFPLHAVLQGHVACEPGLFKWMAEQRPDIILKQDNNGWTPLHIACMCLQKDVSTEICEYLLSNCPESAKSEGSNGELPLHYLLRRTHQQSSQKVAIMLLREYPESFYSECTVGGGPASSNKFLQCIKPVLEEEKELNDTISHLQDLPSPFREAVACTTDPLIKSTYTVFEDWAVSFQRAMNAKMKCVCTNIHNICNEFEADDDDSESDGW